MSKLSYKSLLIVFFFLLIAVVVLSKFVLPKNIAKAAWWNDSWNYRKTISVNNTSGSNLTDFQISISIGTSALIAAGKMQSDCDDIRITDTNGSLLSYWIEPNSCNTGTTKILLNLKSFSTTGNTIFFYYGNSSVSSGNDPSIIPKTCSDVNAFLGTGLFYVDSDGVNGNSPIQAYCDQTTNGGGWTLVASWATAQEWTKTSNSISTVFDTTAKNAVSSNFGNASIYDFRILASDSITTVGTSAYADWYYHYNTATTWKEVWAKSSNTGNSADATYISTSPRQALKPFNYSYNIKFGYQVSQTWNNLSDWGINATSYTGLPDYWKALTTAGNSFGVYGAVVGGGGNDGTLGICPSNQADCITGQDRNVNNAKIGYDDNTPQAGFGSIGTTSVGETPGVQATTKLWWFIRKEIPINKSYSFDSPSAEEVGGGPIAYWKFDEGIGTTVYDSTSNQNNGIFGTGSSSPTWAEESQCISGKCLSFNGNQYINVGSSTKYGSGKTNGSYTVEAWVKPDNLNSHNVITHHLGGIDYFSITGDGSGKLKTMVRDTINSVNYWPESNTSNIESNKWSHVVFILESGIGYKFYINGKLNKNFTNSNLGFYNNVETGYIGFGTSVNDFFKGYIDDVKIYPYARTPAQIKLDYNSHGSASSKGSGVNMGTNKNNNSLSDGLVGYWKIDENIGTTTIDSSGNNHTGTISGATWSSGKYGVGLSFVPTSYLNIGSSILENATVWSVNTQIKYNNQTKQFEFFIGKNTDLTSGKILLRHNGYISFYGTNGTYYDFSTLSTEIQDISKNITFISDGTKISLYVDGIFKSSVTPASTSFSVNTVANAWTDTSWTTSCLIDELRVYNRALSPTEITQLYEYAPGPVGYWDFNENTGTVVKDKSGNNNHCTWSGTGSHWTQGKIGSAGNFNASSSDYVDCGSSSSILSPKYAVTFSNWIKFEADSGDYYGIFQKTGFAKSSGIRSDGSTVWYLDGVTNWVVGDIGALLDHQWHYITGTYDSSLSSNNLKFYVDGKLQNQTSASGIITNDSSSFKIGSTSYGIYNTFQGKIDEVKIYNYARNQKQIIEDMTSNASPVSSKSMLAYYKFDEGNGITAYDSSPKKNNATVNNGIWSKNGKYNQAISLGSTNAIITSNTVYNNSQTFTISAYIYPTALSSFKIIAGTSKGNNVDSGIILNNSNICYHDYVTNSGDYNNCTSNNPIVLNQWQNIVLTYNNGNINIFYNGDKIKNTTFNKTNTSNSLIIGRGSSYEIDRNFVGLIDEVKIYNYALADEEVKQDYNANSALQMGQTTQTIGGTTTSLEYCIPGDTSYCASPMAEWKMDEKVGTSIVDTSGNNNTGNFGTGNSAPSWTQGKIGSGLNFNGTNNFIDVPDLSFSGPFTYSFWLYINDNSGGKMWSSGSNSQKFGQLNNKFFIRIISDSDNSINLPSSNNWHFITLSRNSSDKIDLYVDGISSRLFSDTSQTGNTTFSLIGNANDGSSQFFQGKMDQIRIYNYARTPAQIAYDYNKGAPVGWWKLDECQGNIAYDWSGNNNNGTINIGTSDVQNSLGTCQIGTSAAWTNGANGKINASLNFDGIDDTINVGNPTNIQVEKSDFTIAAWFYPTISKSGMEGIAKSANILNGTATAGGWVVGSTSNYRWRFRVSDSVNVLYRDALDSNTYSLNTWYHVIGIRNNNTIYLYVNGEKVATTDITGLTINSNQNLMIGGRTVGYWLWPGKIDDVRLYNYALTGEQVKQIYNGGAVSFN